MSDIHTTNQTPDYVDNWTYNITTYNNYNYYANG